jgi:hypothetical protein
MRIRLDPKVLSGSGYGSGQLQIQNEFEVKLLRKMIKFDDFSTKMLR